MVLDEAIKLTNMILVNDYVRIFLLIITGVYMGYTLQPVPKWLNNMFDTSLILKFFVLFIASSIAVYPVTEKNIQPVLIGSLLTLGVFHYMRTLDK